MGIPVYGAFVTHINPVSAAVCLDDMGKVWESAKYVAIP